MILHLTEKKEAAISHRLVYCCHQQLQQQAFLSWEPGVHKQTSLTVPTSSLHANDPVRAEPLTVDFLLQVKHPPPINLLIGDAVIMVTSPGTSPLRRGKKGENVIRCLVKMGRTKAWVDQTRTRTTSDNFTYFNFQKCRRIYKLQSKMQKYNTLIPYCKRTKYLNERQKRASVGFQASHDRDNPSPLPQPSCAP